MQLTGLCQGKRKLICLQHSVNVYYMYSVLTNNVLKKKIQQEHNIGNNVFVMPVLKV